MVWTPQGRAGGEPRLQEPTSGEVVFNGRDLVKVSGAERRAMRKPLQVVFQNPYASLNPRFTIGRTLVPETSVV